MTGLENASLSKVIVHKIGNPTRAEDLNLSVQPLTLNDAVVRSMLTRYFLYPFNENELYRFTHLSDVNLNEVYRYTQKIFGNGDVFVEQSHLLARIINSKSTHVKVKEGELYEALFDKIPFEDGETEALGIFKSESRETFLNPCYSLLSIQRQRNPFVLLPSPDATRPCCATWRANSVQEQLLQLPRWKVD